MRLTILQLEGLHCSSVMLQLMMARLNDHLSFRKFEMLKDIYISHLAEYEGSKISRARFRLAKSFLLSLVKSGMVGLGTPYSDGS